MSFTNKQYLKSNEHTIKNVYIDRQSLFVANLSASDLAVQSQKHESYEMRYFSFMMQHLRALTKNSQKCITSSYRLNILHVFIAIS